VREIDPLTVKEFGTVTQKEIGKKGQTITATLDKAFSMEVHIDLQGVTMT
jgi:hypothetical protein